LAFLISVTTLSALLLVVASADEKLFSMGVVSTELPCLLQPTTAKVDASKVVRIIFRSFIVFLWLVDDATLTLSLEVVKTNQYLQSRRVCGERPAYIGAGNALLLGLDINQASGQPAQTLTSFTMSINGVLADSTPGATSVPAGNNGNGYADYLLSNFSSFGANDTILFHFVFSNANDGTENVFLIGGPASSVPEPISVALTGSGLLGLLFLRKRFANR